MIGMTWVELYLVATFAATLVFSVGFCANNYARSEAVRLVRRTEK